MKDQKQIKLSNLAFFVECFNEFSPIEIKYRSEIDGELYVTVEYNIDLFDSDRYESNRLRG